MTMPSEAQSMSYQQEGEYDMTQIAPLMQSTPCHDRDREYTLTTVRELILVSTVDEAMPVSTPTPHSHVVQRRAKVVRMMKRAEHKKKLTQMDEEHE